MKCNVQKGYTKITTNISIGDFYKKKKKKSVNREFGKQLVKQKSNSNATKYSLRLLQFVALLVSINFDFSNGFKFKCQIFMCVCVRKIYQKIQCDHEQWTRLHKNIQIILLCREKKLASLPFTLSLEPELNEDA